MGENEKWINQLIKWNPCPEAVKWARQFLTAREAWVTCERADWLLWVAGKSARNQADYQLVVQAAAACARMVLKYVPAGETYALPAIEAAETWAARPCEETMAATITAASAAEAARANGLAGPATEVAAWAAETAIAAAWATAKTGDEAAWGVARSARMVATDAVRAVAGEAWAAAREAGRVVADEVAWATADAAKDAAEAAAHKEMAAIIRRIINEPK